MSRTPRPLYQEIASKLAAMENCRKHDNSEWEGKHLDDLQTLIDWLPSGSGVDTGTELDTDRSTPNKLVFTLSYHHMNDGGMYDGWTDHAVTVTPSLLFGFDLKVSGRDRNGVKDYLAELYQCALSAEVWQDEGGEWKHAHYHKHPASV